MKLRHHRSTPHITLATHRRQHEHRHHKPFAALSARQVFGIAKFATRILSLYRPPEDAYERAMGYLPKQPKPRNRFQQFFYKVACRLERACSYIDNELASIRASGNDFSKIGEPNPR